MANMGSVGSVFVEVGADLARLNTELGRAVPQAAKAGEDAGQKFAQGFDQQGIKRLQTSFQELGSRLTSIGSALSIGVSAPLVALGAGAIKAAADIDSLKRGLVAVTGSSAEAERQFVQLREVAKLPGLGLEEAARGAVNLQAFGFSAKESVDILKSFGNALATVGKGRAELDRVILQLGQMAGANKVLLQDLRPIIQQVPQVATIIRDNFGPQALSEPAEALEKLGLSSRDFIAVLVRELGKLPAVTGGLKNDLENFSDSIKIALARIGDAMTPVVSRVLNTLVPAIEKAVDVFTALPQPVQEAAVVLGGLFAVSGPVLVGMGLMSRSLSDLIGLFGTFRTVALSAAGAQGLGAFGSSVSGVSASLSGLAGAGGLLALGGIALASFGAAALATAGQLDELRNKSDSFGESLRSMRIGELLGEGKTIDQIQQLGFSLDEIKRALLGATIETEKWIPPANTLGIEIVGLNDSAQAAATTLPRAAAGVKEFGGSSSEAAAKIRATADALRENQEWAERYTASLVDASVQMAETDAAAGDMRRTIELLNMGTLEGTQQIGNLSVALEQGVIALRGNASAANELTTAYTAAGNAAEILARNAEATAASVAAAARTIQQSAGFGKLTGGTIGLPGFGNAGDQAAGAGLPTDALQMMIAAMTMGFQDAGLISSQSIENMRRLGWTFTGGRSFEPTEKTDMALAIAQIADQLRSVNRQLPRDMQVHALAGGISSDTYAALSDALRQATDNLNRFRQGIDTTGRSLKSAADIASDLSKQTADRLVPTYQDLEDQLWRLIDVGQGNSSAAWDLRNKMASMGNAFTDAAPAIDTLTRSAVRAGTSIVETGMVVEAVANRVATTTRSLARMAGLGEIPAIEPSPTGPAIPATGTVARFAAYGDNLQYSGGGFTVNVYGGIYGPDSPRYFAEQVTDILRQDARLG